MPKALVNSLKKRAHTGCTWKCAHRVQGAPLISDTAEPIVLSESTLSLILYSVQLVNRSKLIRLILSCKM